MQIVSFVVVSFLLLCGLLSGYAIRPKNEENESMQCIGKLKSPINKRVLLVKTKEFPDIDYYNNNIIPEKVQLMNTGHSILINMDYEEGKEPSIFGGPMERKFPYRFEYFELFWGPNNSVIITNVLPLEMHMVLRSMQYKDFVSARAQDYGIAVLTFSFRLSGTDHPYLDEFVQKISWLKSEALSIYLDKPVAIERIIPWNLLNYYSYIGSLTKAPCAKKVVWLDFQDSIFISEKQFNYLRQLNDYDAQLTMNIFQPSETVNQRTIFLNVPSKLSFSKGNHYNPVTIPTSRNSCDQYGKQSFLLITLVNCALLFCLQYQ